MEPKLYYCRKRKKITHAGIIGFIDTVFIESNKIELNSSFKDLVYQIKANELRKRLLKIHTRCGNFFGKIEAYRAKD